MDRCGTADIGRQARKSAPRDASTPLHDSTARRIALPVSSAVGGVTAMPWHRRAFPTPRGGGKRDPQGGLARPPAALPGACDASSITARRAPCRTAAQGRPTYRGIVQVSTRASCLRRSEAPASRRQAGKRFDAVLSSDIRRPSGRAGRAARGVEGLARSPGYARRPSPGGSAPPDAMTRLSMVRNPG